MTSRLLIACLLLVAATTHVPSEGQNLRVAFHEVLVIGDDESRPAAYLFRHPVFAATNSAGDIFVIDAMQQAIRRFDARGRHIENIGRQGSGPGEFSDIQAMTAVGDTLVVFDRMNNRITRYDTFGRTFTMFVRESEVIVSPAGMAPLGDGEVVIYYDNTFREAPHRRLLHHLNADGTLRASLGRVDQFWDLSSVLDRSLAGNPVAVRLIPTGSEGFVLAPLVYGGRLFRYRSEGGNWLLQRLQGAAGTGPVTTPLPANILDRYPIVRPAYGLFIFAGDDRVTVQMNRRSGGGYMLPDGQLVHITLERTGRRWMPTAEIFDADGRLVDYGTIRNITPGTDDFEQVFDILWTDPDGKIYVAGRTDVGAPVLRVGYLRF
jgi:hypothetical protein